MSPALIIFAVTFLNVFATRRLFRSGLPARARVLQIIMVWLVPVIGAGFALLDTSSRKSSKSAREEPPSNREPAPEYLELDGGPSFPVVEFLMDGQGFPILDWNELTHWSESVASPDLRRSAIERGRRAWLLHLRDKLGDNAHLVETDEAWVLSSYEPKVARAAARYVATTRQRIAQLLDGIAHFPEGSRSILVVLDHQDDYYHYITNYYPDEGQFSYSSGVFVNPGCPHFITVSDNLAVIEPVIAHEMTHAALTHLQLPKWLDEGIAVTTEHRISTSHRSTEHVLELIGKHREFWSVEKMQEFWCGSSFDRGDDGNALSYDLARHMVALIGRDWETFTKFVRNVKRTDAGAAASNAELKLDLGDLAAAAIGIPAQPGFSPDPESWRTAAD